MQCALVAGGSKGIGFAIAEALARRRYNLILVGRDLNALDDAKMKLESAYQVHVDTIVADLALASSAKEIADWCTEKNILLTMLCNVAGLGGPIDYLSLPVDKLRNMVELNVQSVIALCQALLPLLEKNAPAYILNVSSMAGFAPIPVKNVYASTKAAIIFFSYSLRYQVKRKNISVSCLCPGPVFTKAGIEKDTADKAGWFGKKMAVNPKKVGEIAVRRTLNGRLIIVPGLLAKSMSVILRVLPRRLIALIYYKLGEKSTGY